MKLGATLLICDSSYDLLIPNILYHFLNGVDYIECVANKPSEKLLERIHVCANHFKNIHFIINNDNMGPKVQESLVNYMIKNLIENECTWAMNIDDDEFYCGPLKNVINSAESSGYNYILTNGYCFYETEEDIPNTSPPRKMIYRDSDTINYEFRKPIFKTKFFKTSTPGNHYIHFKNIKDTKYCYTTNITIFHYTHRSKLVAYAASTHGKQEYSNFKQLTKKEIEDMKLVKDERLKNYIEENMCKKEK